MTVKQQHQCFHLPSPPVTPLPPDTPVFVLGPRYDPSDPGAGGTAHISAVDSPLPLYLMMGRELFPVRRGEGREAGATSMFPPLPSPTTFPCPGRYPARLRATWWASAAWAATSSR